MALEVPASTTPFRLNRKYVATIIAMHLLALLALHPYFFSWVGFLTMLMGIHVFGQGITIGYHRLLTHRSFKTPVWVEHLIAILGICCMEDSPARWVAIHRIHHVHSDQRPDPHTPLVNFFWSHMGWLMVLNKDTHSLSAIEKFAKDLLRDPFYMRLEKKPWIHAAIVLSQFPLFFLFGYILGYLVWGPANAMQLGASMLVWGFYVRVVAVWHITWSVNSLSHMFGYQNYKTDEASRNNWFVALLTVGEGWHNNHHEDPSTACLQHRWWELDLSYYEIKLMEWIGLASEIVPPRYLRHSSNKQAA